MNLFTYLVFQIKNVIKRFGLVSIVFLAFLLYIIYHIFNFKQSMIDSNSNVKEYHQHLNSTTNQISLDPTTDKINACIFILLKNSDLKVFTKTMLQFEKQFNSKFNYPYVLMNHENFTLEFQKEIVQYTKSKIEFGVIPFEQWSVPSWIDKHEFQHRLKTSLLAMIGSKAHIVSYHFMCRFFSGFFFRHELTLKYDYYWRLDHHVSFPCVIDEDLFLKLKNENKYTYGFVMTRDEDMSTIPTLWKTINEWLESSGFKNRMPLDNARSFVSSGGNSINNCVIFNNFELASFKIFRNDMYLSFFDYLDRAGGFFYERWGDAPVHTYYAILMLRKSEMIRFENIGYGHGNMVGDDWIWPGNSSIKCEEKRRKLKPAVDKCNQEWHKLFEKI